MGTGEYETRKDHLGRVLVSNPSLGDEEDHPDRFSKISHSSSRECTRGRSYYAGRHLVTGSWSDMDSEECQSTYCTNPRVAGDVLRALGAASVTHQLYASSLEIILQVGTTFVRLNFFRQNNSQSKLLDFLLLVKFD